ncbi:Mitochondrial import protein TIM15 [Niveomyces insectorum RCEF 264]|uniref:Mitochondrial import protein TIM15 n=1 Tax=Niveomyces insectorum RCEF 264 TaxID=1081102 RepID=A0A167Z2G2_9HYPO|nr:Mitochondrial import protein TIM15 [Niveomyces insectorum RCEF 264]
MASTSACSRLARPLWTAYRAAPRRSPRQRTSPLSSLPFTRHLSSSSSRPSSLSPSALRFRTPTNTPTHTPTRTPAFSRPGPAFLALARGAHTIPRPRQPAETDGEGGRGNPSTDLSSSQQQQKQKQQKTGLAPHYELTFTCVPCGARSAHNVSKQGYHHGSVLITCPSCRNRHVISDHLGIFGTPLEDGARTVEDILRARGRLVKRGALGEDGDVEFWEDGTTSSRPARLAAEDVMLPVDKSGDGMTEAEAAEVAAAAAAAPGATFKSAKKAANTD